MGTWNTILSRSSPMACWARWQWKHITSLRHGAVSPMESSAGGSPARNGEKWRFLTGGEAICPPHSKQSKAAAAANGEEPAR